MSSYDVIIVGCGAIGCAVAREASFVHGKTVLVLEKNEDVLCEASGGNTGHLATNFYYTASRAPAEHAMTRRASETNGGWIARQENVPREKRGLLFLAYSKEEMEELEAMKKVGEEENGESGLRMLRKEQIEDREPDMNVEGVQGGLLSENEYVVDSFLLPLSNLFVALETGRCKLETVCPVSQIRKTDEGLWKVVSEDGREFEGRCLINCAGNFSDDVHGLVEGRRDFNIRPARGEYLVVPREKLPKEKVVNSMVVRAPTKATAGPYVFQSVHGDFVVGPTRQVQDSKTDRENRPEALRSLAEHARKMFPTVDCEGEFSSFCGLRPASDHYDYQLKIDPDKMFATAGAIRSTGLTCSRAIAENIATTLWGKGSKNVSEEPVMPAPKSGRHGRIWVGKYSFRPGHPLFNGA